MTNVITLIVLSSVVLFMSGCSQLPRDSSTQRTKAYAYRTPQPQYQPQTLPPQTNREPITTDQPPSPAAELPLSSPVPARNQMVGIIKSTLGTPYKWGGNNPQRGFDCSGLMSYVHKNAGLKIPRTAAMQRDNSRTIDYNQLQPGDMLFFKINSKTNHVGMYIGNRKFIHAPSSGKTVTVASMDSSYWYKRFVKFGTYIQ
jgi:cell wall-associated NlpC family hydrolase